MRSGQGTRARAADRAYAVIVVMTLALAIGATTAVFSIVNGVLLKPLAYRESHRLVALREVWREFSSRAPTLAVNERHFEYWRAHATTFESLAQYRPIPANLTGSGEATQITVVHCSGSLFDVLQVKAARGRTLSPSDDPPESRESPRPGTKGSNNGGDVGGDVAVITDALWRRLASSTPAAPAGRALAVIVLDGKPYTVVGVLPQDFRLPMGTGLPAEADAFVPLSLKFGWVGDHNDQAIGRLRDGVSVDQARAELDVLQTQTSRLATKEAHERVTLASAVTPLSEQVVGSSRRGLLLLLAAIAAVLLIACANLASLALARTIGRMRETAIRSALGASRRRLVGRAVLEQLRLSAVGGALGIWVAWAALASFVRTAPVDLPRVDEVALDARVILFAGAASILAGLLVAIVPAWRIAGRDMETALRAGAVTVTGGPSRLVGHAMLLGLQVGLSVTLLVVTALLGVSLVRVMTVNRGFTAEGVLAIDVALPANGYADERTRQAAYDRLLAAIHTLPGVEAASTTSLLPLRGEGQVNTIAPVSGVDKSGAIAPVSGLPTANFRFVAPEFFQTLGILVRRGRSFTDAERDPRRPTPALVSEPAAARLWPGEDAIGRRFVRSFVPDQLFEVVGIVADARTTSLENDQPLMVYVPYWGRSRTSTSLLIKTVVDAAALTSAVRRAIHGIDPDIAVGQSRPLERLVDLSVASRRYQVRLFVAFALVAMFIAILGVYAVTSYGVSGRRREMNIRVALGAQTSDVIGLVLRQGMAPVVAGVAAGACGALAIGRLLASLLFEVRARDPIVIVAVASIVTMAGLTTCALAARRGLAIEPAAALRDE